MKKLVFVLFILFCGFISHGQNIKLDSVLFANRNKADSVNVQLLLDCYKEYSKGNILEGKVFLDNALILAEKMDEKNWKGKVLLSYGNYYNIIGEYQNAIKYYNESRLVFKLAKKDYNVGSVFINLGSTYEKMGNYEEAMDNLIKALGVFETINDSLSIAKSYLNLGLLFSRQKDYKKSMEYYNKSLEIRIKIKDEDGIALLYNNMAIVNYYLEDYDNVRSYFEKAYHIYIDTENLRGQLMALSNLGEVFNLIGQKEKALSSYFKILEIEEQLGHKGEQAQTHFLIGDLYQSRGDFQSAKKHMYISLDIAKEVGALSDIRDVYSNLTNIYTEEKNFEKALEFQLLFFDYNDSLFNIEKSNQIAELETQYETKKKEQQIINLENEKIIQDLKIKKQRIVLVSFIGGLIFITIFLWIAIVQKNKIRAANVILAYQKKQITDSIEYASRIQTAILPPGDYISRIIPEHFIVYKPRDIVSGDFYWITHKEGKIVVAVVDCTGHGVPGAFMSMLGFAFLNEIVNREKNLKANEILNQLRDNVKESLHQTGKEDEAKDGMDIALCIIDPEKLSMQFAGAYNPLYLLRNNDLITLKADRMPIGIHVFEKDSFTNHEMKIQKGDTIYVFTDGYIDQFGGKKMQKFKIAPFKDLLISLQHKSMDQQKHILEETLDAWMGDHEQIDDILVMGIKI